MLAAIMSEKDHSHPGRDVAEDLARGAIHVERDHR